MAWPLPAAWKTASPQLVPGKNEVHLWLAAVPDCIGQLPKLEKLLTPEERERACRFVFVRDRERYTVARGVLRDLLARYLGSQEFTIGANAHGKPRLESPGSDLEFNVSHSRDLALFGFTRGTAIGVDVEWIRPDFATAEIARRFFAKDEASALEALPESERVRGFFDCWSRKEAYIKARGVGLSLGLSTFAVTLSPGEPVALVRVDTDPEAPKRWTLLNLEAGSDYCAAAAFEARDFTIEQYRWGTNPS
jgi:4'-phosphopantetheinyl transferase